MESSRWHASSFPARLSRTDHDRIWGDPPPGDLYGTGRAVRELMADLTVLVADVRRGPMTRFLADAQAYLGELRREFLRHHRRLLVHAQKTADDARVEMLRSEQAELAERFRGVVLGRSSRVPLDEWGPSKLVEALDRAVEVLPESVPAVVHADLVKADADDGPWRGFRRAWLRSRRRVGGWLGIAIERRIPLRDLGRHHLSYGLTEQLEAMVAVVIEAEVQLSNFTRMLVEGVFQGYDNLLKKEGDFADRVRSFRQQVEDELALADGELNRVLDEGSRRMARILGERFKRLESDLTVVGSFALPARKRTKHRIVERSSTVEDLTARMNEVRHSLAGGYGLLGLRLELAAFRARIRVSMERQVRDLEQDIRGRSLTQLDRVLSGLEDAQARLVAEPEAEAAPTTNETQVREVLEPLERVVLEALRGAHQLVEQLSAEQAAAVVLDALTKETQTLTDRYSVVVSKVPHAEWCLPPAVPVIELGFAALVRAYIETDVAPELLAITESGLEVVEPLISALQDLERAITFESDEIDGDAELVTEDLDHMDLAKVMAGALERSRATLAELRDPTEAWPDAMGGRLRSAVLEKIDGLQKQLADGEVEALRSRRIGGAYPRRLERQVNRLTALLNRVGERSWRSVRTMLGEPRLARWRSRLKGGEVPAPVDMLDALRAPKSTTEVPPFYRRLFAANAYWAGDVLEEQRQAAERLVRVLSGRPGVSLRTAAIVSPDGLGQGALLGAVSRRDRWSQVRRVTFTHPMSKDEVEHVFDELGQGQLVIVSGLYWMLSARPGGLEPLRSFVDGVVSDAGRNAFLVEASELVWQYAAQVAALSQVFDDVVPMRPLSPAELMQAVLSRHRLSGLEVEFASEREPDPIVAKDQYFSELHAVSGGLLQTALSLWMASLTEVDESAAKVTMGSPPPPVLPVLRRLEDEVMQMLYLVLRQGWMDAPTLAYLLREPPAFATGQLAKMGALGLLERKSPGVYLVRRHLRGAILTRLAEWGWLE